MDEVEPFDIRHLPAGRILFVLGKRPSDKQECRYWIVPTYPHKEGEYYIYHYSITSDDDRCEARTMDPGDAEVGRSTHGVITVGQSFEISTIDGPYKVEVVWFNPKHLGGGD